MRKILILLILVACLLFVTSTDFGQKSKDTMNNADVIAMVNAALSESVIATAIRQATSKSFDLSPSGLIALKKAGVTDALIQVLQEVSAPPNSSTNIGPNKASVDDREPIISTYFRQLVISQSGGAISVSSFQKTNGYEQDATKLYVLEWQADIVFEQAGYKAGNAFVGYWQDFRVLKQQPGTLDSLVVGNTILFNKGATVRIRGNSTFRKTEQGWRLEDFKLQTTQVLSDGGSVAQSPGESGLDKVTGLATSNPESVESLTATIERGEEVVFKIRYFQSSWNLLKDSGMVDGLVTVSKAAIVFRPEGGEKVFSVTPDKIIELFNEPQQARRIRMKVSILNKKGDKEEKKDFQFYHPSAFANGMNISCSTLCDNSMSGLYAALQKARSIGPNHNALSGKYFRKDKRSDYIEFSLDGTFSLLQGDKRYIGNYSSQADNLTVQVMNAKSQVLRIVGNTIVEPDGTIWEKQLLPD